MKNKCKDFEDFIENFVNPQGRRSKGIKEVVISSHAFRIEFEFEFVLFE
jgi:hypothetical protein